MKWDVTYGHGWNLVAALVRVLPGGQVRWRVGCEWKVPRPVPPPVPPKYSTVVTIVIMLDVGTERRSCFLGQAKRIVTILRTRLAIVPALLSSIALNSAFVAPAVYAHDSQRSEADRPSCGTALLSCRR